jgi:hypothetical protein
MAVAVLLAGAGAVTCAYWLYQLFFPDPRLDTSELGIHHPKNKVLKLLLGVALGATCVTLSLAIMSVLFSALANI